MAAGNSMIILPVSISLQVEAIYLFTNGTLCNSGKEILFQKVNS